MLTLSGERGCQGLQDQRSGLDNVRGSVPRLHQESPEVAGAKASMSSPAPAFSGITMAASGLGARIMTGSSYQQRQGSGVIGKPGYLDDLNRLA